MVHLSTTTLAELSDRLPVPSYDRSQLTVGIVHLGVGGFHRAHEAMYVERIADPAVRIVSLTLTLTLTLGGFDLHLVSGEFLTTTADVVHDLSPGAAPRTSFGLVTEALVRRRERGTPPFTIMSCDNIAGNGAAARPAFGSFARLRDRELGEWVEREVGPDSMVDRITPVTTDEDRDGVTRRFGVEDRWPVVCEPFTQWVLEDAFAAGRPPWESAGVQVVADVEPYELSSWRARRHRHRRAERARRRAERPLGPQPAGPARARGPSRAGRGPHRLGGRLRRRHGQGGPAALVLTGGDVLTARGVTGPSRREQTAAGELLRPCAQVPGRGADEGVTDPAAPSG